MKDKPMPLSDLPEYIKSVRDHGQSDFVPVVEMGRIVTPNKPRLRLSALVAAASFLLIVCGVLGYDAASKNIILTAAEGMDSKAVAQIVSDGGARVMSVTKNDDETYEVKVLTLKNLGSLLDNLKKNKEFKKVEAR